MVLCSDPPPNCSDFSENVIGGDEHGGVACGTCVIVYSIRALSSRNRKRLLMRIEIVNMRHVREPLAHAHPRRLWCFCK